MKTDSSQRGTLSGSGNEDVEEYRRLALEHGIEFLEAIPDEILVPDLVQKIPVDWARSNCLLTVRMGDEYCVLTADPSAISQQEYLALLIGHDLRPVLAPRSAILRSIEKSYFSRDESPKDFLKDLSMAGQGGASSERPRGDDLLQVAENAPVTQLINLILLEAVKARASDIHFEPFESRLVVRYRIDGMLYEKASPPKHLQDALASRLKVMAKMDIAEKRLPQDGMARVRVGEREIDIRVSTVPVAEGERVVLRILDRDSALLPLQTLGMRDDALRQFESLLGLANGIIVVSGPTGSGKTTTLYAALGRLDSGHKNILTIEDPVEYQLPNIGQIQVKPKIGLTFANGLRHILRQDPDIILVGEIRDIDTAEIAIRASLTGHLVFTTLHTNDAPGAVLRLVDMGVERYLLASCLRGVLAQRLVRTLCVRCRKAVDAGAADRLRIGRVMAGGWNGKVYEAAGCSSCLDGFKGRTGLFEMMLVDSRMQELIRTGGVNADALGRLAVENGMVGLMDDGARKIGQGITSVAEVVSAVGVNESLRV
ncbi:MAG: type II secretion system protein GspE [Verrucomicrobia bacterium]|nr:type II secretion system protein GspE [Verrucomicrobiota bacterium]